MMLILTVCVVAIVVAILGAVVARQQEARADERHAELVRQLATLAEQPNARYKAIEQGFDRLMEKLDAEHAQRLEVLKTTHQDAAQIVATTAVTAERTKRAIRGALNTSRGRQVLRACLARHAAESEAQG